MILAITNPKGIDIPVSRMQAFIHSNLLSGWGLTADEYRCYARCYRQRLDSSYIPAVFDGNDYRDVFADDTVAAQSFFGVGERVQYKTGNGAATDVHLVFFVNLDRLGTTKELTHRGDEEAKLDVLRLVQKNRYGFTLTGVRTGIDNVFAEYPGSMRNRVYRADLKRYHCFRFDFTLAYQPLDCPIDPLGLPECP